MGVGTEFVTSSKFLRHSTRCEVTEYEPARRLAWRATSGAHTTTTWDLQPSGPSARITFTRVADAHGLLRLPHSLLQGFANGRVDQELATLKELLAVTRTPAARGW